MGDAHGSMDEADRRAATRTLEEEAAREARLASMGRHQQVVNGLADDYNSAIQQNDLQGFFERAAARIIRAEPPRKMPLASYACLLDKVEAVQTLSSEMRITLLQVPR